MSTLPKLGDKVFKVVTGVLVVTTAVSFGSLGVNIYFNTGSRRKTTLKPPPSDGASEKESIQPVGTTSEAPK